MSAITTQDGVEIFYKDWGHGQPIVTAIASSSTTGAAMVAPPRSAAATTWITTPTTWRR